MVNHNMGDIGPGLANLGGNLLKYPNRHRLIGLIFQGDDGFPLGVVAYHATHDNHCTVGGIICKLIHFLEGKRRKRDGKLVCFTDGQRMCRLSRGN